MIKPRSGPGSTPSGHYEWAAATAFRYYGAAQWLPVLMELQSSPQCAGDALSFANYILTQQRLGAAAPAWAHQVQVPQCFNQAAWMRMKGPLPFIALFVTPQFLAVIVAGGAPAANILRFELGAALPYPLGGLLNLSCGNAPSPAQAPRAVLGLIDDGIAFAHDRFLDASGGTRIEYLWDQGAPPGGSPWGLGVEIEKHRQPGGIDALMKSCQHGGLVDEDEVYVRSGFVDRLGRTHNPLAARATHGTHVLDLASHCGSPPPADREPIIAVQLPGASVADTSGATLGPQVLLAFLYIVWRADCLAQRANSTQPLPLIVNISLGIAAGPHDGSSLFERCLDALIQLCNTASLPTHVVLPSGNHRLAQGHAEVDLAPGSSARLRWRLLPDDQTESHAEVWLPPVSGNSPLRLRLHAPDSSVTSAWVDSNLPGWQWPATPAAPIALISRVVDPGNGQVCFRLHLAPTADPDGLLPLAPAGVWDVELDNPGAVPVKGIHASIQRDDTAFGHRARGRQSRFDDAQYERFDARGRPLDTDPVGTTSYVRRSGSYSAYAGGTEPVVIGSYRASDSRSVGYSGIGPTMAAKRGQPNPHGPDALLPSEDSPSQRGLLAAGTRSGSCVAMGGTSVAAPLAANWLLLNGKPSPSGRAQVSIQAAASPVGAAVRPVQTVGGAGQLQWPDVPPWPGPLITRKPR